MGQREEIEAGEVMPVGKIERESCRICYEDSSDLIAPCRCTGSIGRVHRRCLETWLTISGRRDCDMCRFPYQTIGGYGSFVDFILHTDQWEMVYKLNIYLGILPVLAVVLGECSQIWAAAASLHLSHSGTEDCSEVRRLVLSVESLDALWGPLGETEKVVTVSVCMKQSRVGSREAVLLGALLILLVILWVDFFFKCWNFLKLRGCLWSRWRRTRNRLVTIILDEDVKKRRKEE